MGITERTKNVCRKFVETHLPAEIPYFETAWSAAIGSIGLTDLAKASAANLEVIRERLTPPSMNRMFPSTLNTRLDYALLVMMACVIELRSMKLGPRISGKDITRTVQSVVSHSKVPPDIASLLNRSVPQLIANIYEVNHSQDAQQTRSIPVKGKWFTEWRLPTQCTAVQGYKTRAEIERKLRKLASELDLVVDEEKGEIAVRGWTRSGRRPQRHRTVKLGALQKRHRVLLGLILESLPDRGLIGYAKILRRTHGQDMAVTSNARDNIRRTKSELNRRLNRVLGKVVKAARGHDRYEISKAPFSYCWIRHEEGASALFRDNE